MLKILSKDLNITAIVKDRQNPTIITQQHTETNVETKVVVKIFERGQLLGTKEFLNKRLAQTFVELNKSVDDISTPSTMREYVIEPQQVEVNLDELKHILK